MFGLSSGNTTNSNSFPTSSSNDLLGVTLFFLPLITLALFSPNLLTDPENYIPANPLVTPIHIMPEWYFLWAYAILRSIPNNLGGVIAIFAAILILFTPPFLNTHLQNGYSFHPPTQIIFWTLVTTFFLLTWIGGRPVEPPYEYLGQYFTALYFLIHPAIPLSANLWQQSIQ